MFPCEFSISAYMDLTSFVEEGYHLAMNRVSLKTLPPGETKTRLISIVNMLII